MAPVIDHATHEKVIEKAGTKYGCHNRERPIKGAPVVSVYALPRSWPYVFSEECRYDMSLQDAKCEGCDWRGSGEFYSGRIREVGE